MTRKVIIGGALVCVIITVGMFSFIDYSQDMLLVSQRTIGALILVFLANSVVAVASGILGKGQRFRVFLWVLLAGWGFLVIVFIGVGFWADLFAWHDD